LISVENHALTGLSGVFHNHYKAVMFWHCIDPTSGFAGFRMLGRNPFCPAATHPFFPFLKLSFDLVKSQPYGNVQIIMCPALFFSMCHEGSFGRHSETNGHLEDIAPVTVVHLIDHDLAAATG